MTEEKYNKIMEDFDKKFNELIPPCPKGTLAIPLLEMTEVITGPEWDKWVEKIVEENEDYQLWYPIRFKKGEQGFTENKIVIHSEFIAMNCVKAHNNSKLDWVRKQVGDIKGQFKKWDSNTSEWYDWTDV
jgi:hypothetical protein